MKKEDLLEATTAIKTHFTKSEGGFTYMRYAGYDHVPWMACSPSNLEAAFQFLTLYAKRESFQNDSGGYDEADFDTIKYLAMLSRWGFEYIAGDQKLLRDFERGFTLDFDTLLPKIEEKRQEAQAAVDFIKPVARLYKAAYTIAKNRSYRSEASAEDNAKLIDYAQQHGMHTALDFVRQHTDPKIIEAQIGALEKLAQLTERYYALSKRISDAGCPATFMTITSSSLSSGYRLMRESLPSFFDNYLDFSGLDLEPDLRNLIMEPAPASNYIRSLIGAAFETAAREHRESDTHGPETAAAWERVRGERAFLDERKMPKYQPKEGSLEKAIAAVTAKIDAMHTHLDRVETDLGNYIGTWGSRVKNSQQNGGLERGS